ncbi:12147_t:CDS:2, partial [Gigaspora rosea]
MDVEMEDSDQQISSRPTVDTRLSKKARTSQTASSELALHITPVVSAHHPELQPITHLTQHTQPTDLGNYNSVPQSDLDPWADP